MRRLLMYVALAALCFSPFVMARLTSADTPAPVVRPSPEPSSLYSRGEASVRITGAALRARTPPPSPTPKPRPSWFRHHPYGTPYPEYIETVEQAALWVQRVWKSNGWGSITLAHAEAIVLGKAAVRPPPPPPPPGLIWPLRGTLMQPFGCTGFYLEPAMYGCAHFHTGIDISAAYGSAVRASCTGKVIWSGWKSDGGGYAVDIACTNGLTVSNNHLSSVLVGLGAWVGAGRTVGAVGMSGTATGPHLHFSVKRNGVYVNPLAYL